MLKRGISGWRKKRSNNGTFFDNPYKLECILQKIKQFEKSHPILRRNVWAGEISRKFFKGKAGV